MKKEAKTGNDAVIEHLERITARALSTESNGGVTLPQQLIDALTAQLALLKTTHLITRTSNETWRHINGTRKDVMDELMLKLRGFWTGLTNDHRLGLIDARVLDILELPSLRPTNSTSAPWKSLAERTLQGANRAGEMGIELVTRPTTEEIAEVLTRLRELEVQATDAKLTLRGHQKQRREAKAHALRLINAVAHHVRFTLFGEKQELIREILRGFGFRFKSVETAASNTDEPGNQPPTISQGGDQD